MTDTNINDTTTQRNVVSIDNIVINAIYSMFVITSSYKCMTTNRPNLFKTIMSPILSYFAERFITVFNLMYILSPAILLMVFVYMLFTFTNKHVMILNNTNNTNNVINTNEIIVERKMNEIACKARKQLQTTLDKDSKVDTDIKHNLIEEYGDYIDNTIGYHMYKYSESSYNMSFGYYDFREYIKDLYTYTPQRIIKTIDDVQTSYIFNCEGYEYENGNFIPYRMHKTDMYIMNDIQVYRVYGDYANDNTNIVKDDFVLIVGYYESEYIKDIKNNIELFFDENNLGFGEAFNEYCLNICYDNPDRTPIEKVGRVVRDKDEYYRIINFMQ